MTLPLNISVTLTTNQVIQKFGADLNIRTTTSVRKPKSNLSQRLELFDPLLHGNEVMVAKLIGAEIIK